MPSKVNWVLRTSVLGVSVLLLAAGQAASAACLLKTQQSTFGPAYTLMVAPSAELLDYAALGFSPIACPQDMTLVRAYVERICASPGKSPAPALDTQAVIGLSRERACASARAGLAETGN